MPISGAISRAVFILYLLKALHPCSSGSSRGLLAHGQSQDLAEFFLGLDDLFGPFELTTQLRRSTTLASTGRSHRYSATQIRYHYTKDREVLRRVPGSAGL
jgi:hypothetical protein